jgi:hypothetical protein
MKYSEYLQFRELLESNGITLEEYKKDPKLYEGVLSTLGKGMWNLAKKGMKVALSKGISNNKKEELNKAAESIRKWILDEVNNAEKDENHPIHKLLTRKKDAEKLVNDPQKRDVAEKALRVYDRELASFLRKKVQNRVKAIEQKIAKNKNITDEDKNALQEYWDDLSINLEISITEALSDADIIEEDTVENWLKQMSQVQRMGAGEKKSKQTKIETTKV